MTDIDRCTLVIDPNHYYGAVYHMASPPKAEKRYQFLITTQIINYLLPESPFAIWQLGESVRTFHTDPTSKDYDPAKDVFSATTRKLTMSGNMLHDVVINGLRKLGSQYWKAFLFDCLPLNVFGAEVEAKLAESNKYWIKAIQLTQKTT